MVSTIRGLFYARKHADVAGKTAIYWDSIRKDGADKLYGQNGNGYLYGGNGNYNYHDAFHFTALFTLIEGYTAGDVIRFYCKKECEFQYYNEPF